MSKTTLASIYTDSLTKSCSTISCVCAFTEYLKSHLADVREFINSNAGVMSIPVTYTVEGEEVSQTVALSAAQYQDCLQGTVDAVNVVVNDSLDSVQISANEVLDAVENHVAELRVQSSFLDYCLEQGEVDSTGFITRTRALVPSAPSDTIEQYATYLQTGGSPVDALLTFFGAARSAENPDGFLTMVSKDDFIGNPWAVVFAQIAEDVTTLLTQIAWATLHIDKAITVLKMQCQKVIKWAGGLLFKDLLTVYSKASSAPAGIMDLPLFQLTCGYGGPGGPLTPLTALYDASYSVYPYLYSVEPYARRLNPNIPTLIRNHVNRSFDNLFFRYDGDTLTPSITEVVIPSEPFDLVLRFGVINNVNQDKVMSCHFAAPYDSWAQYTDAQAERAMIQSFSNACIYLSHVVPFGTAMPRDSIVGYAGLIDLENSWPISSDGSASWPERLNYLDFDLGQLIVDNSYAGFRELVAAMITYAIIMSKGFVSNIGVTDGDMTPFVMQTWLANDVSYVDPQYEGLIEVSGDGLSFDTRCIDNSVFRPYSQSRLLPVTVHYQTVNEQANEILRTLRVTAAVVVVVFAVHKFNKWKRRRLASTALANANADRLAWEAAANPTDGNIQAFNSAFNKARRMDKLNALLGLASNETGSRTAEILQSALNGISSSSRTSSNNYSSLSGELSSSENALTNRINRIQSTLKE